MTYTITINRIESTDPRLNRHVRHDSRSRQFAFPEGDAASLQSVRHTRHIPVLDQGNLGSCTGNAAVGAIGTTPLWDVEPAATELDETEALKVYSLATTYSSPATPYPPNDPGSDGLSVAKAAKKLNLITGYQHAFSLNAALLALQTYPVIIGINWYDSMFNPDADGRLQISGNVAGGHEIVVDEIDVANERVWITNSWGAAWGLQGRAYLTWADFQRLLNEQGDVTVLLPLSVPAPTPTPVPVPVPPTPVPTPAPPAPPAPPEPTPPPVPPTPPVTPVDPAVQALADAMKGWLAATGL